MSSNIKKEYPFNSQRTGIWKEIVRYIVKDVLFNKTPVNICVEIGSGFCDFINQFPAKKKICYEQNDRLREYASLDVEFRNENAVNLNGLEKQSVDLIFASNFLEHLSKFEHDILLPKIFEALKFDGHLILIQPNYSLCSLTYFVDETHITVFDEQIIKEFLIKYGFIISKIVPNFLPFSMKSKLPKWPFLVRLYLNSPIRPNAGQMFVVAIKR